MSNSAGDVEGNWEVLRPDGLSLGVMAYWEALQQRALHGGSIRRIGGDDTDS